MKTPTEWMEEWFPAMDTSNWPIAFTKAHIEAIQHDARESMEHAVQDWIAKAEEYKINWHQARRYLRQANKGAERNNMVMRLQAADISSLLDRIKQLEQRP